ncbi:unnamed protein product [Durusdinium trenchii]|uniref:Uncharacterized protein n=1 Tax=Durusdinium trenchii TaxID=1381693 RepID=A0ABP0PE59_9DINO
MASLPLCSRPKRCGSSLNERSHVQMVRALALALVLWGLGSARLTKPKGVELDDQELTALAQLSEKAERVKDEETSQEDASDEDNIDKLKEEPLNRSKSEEEKELKEQENEQGKVKIVRDEATPKQITRVDVKVHHANQPLPEDEKVDVTVIVNDTKAAQTTVPPKPAVSIDINTKEVVVSDVTETTTTKAFFAKREAQLEEPWVCWR